MKTIIDKNYGADADGNRGMTMVECEIEESDRPEIERQVAEILKDYDEDDQPIEVTITLSDGDYECDFDVDVEDYK